MLILVLVLGSILSSILGHWGWGTDPTPLTANRFSFEAASWKELHSHRGTAGSVTQEASTHHSFALLEGVNGWMTKSLSLFFFFYTAVSSLFKFKFQRSFVCSRGRGGTAEAAFHTNLAKGERKCGRATGRRGSDVFIFYLFFFFSGASGALCSGGTRLCLHCLRV